MCRSRRSSSTKRSSSPPRRASRATSCQQGPSSRWCRSPKRMPRTFTFRTRRTEDRSDPPSALISAGSHCDGVAACLFTPQFSPPNPHRPRRTMTRPVTLFTAHYPHLPPPPPPRRPMTSPFPLFPGQWAALPLAELAPLAKRMGYDGLELACGGDHFDVQAALADAQYVKDKRALLEWHGLQCLAIGNHLV